LSLKALLFYLCENPKQFLTHFWQTYNIINNDVYHRCQPVFKTINNVKIKTARRRRRQQQQQQPQVCFSL
jgi:hypothetical protein